MEHIYNTRLSFGVLGERDVEVFYSYSEAKVSNGRSVCAVRINAICTYLNGKQIDFTYLVRDNQDLMDDLAHECKENHYD